MSPELTSVLAGTGSLVLVGLLRELHAWLKKRQAARDAADSGKAGAELGPRPRVLTPQPSVPPWLRPSRGHLERLHPTVRALAEQFLELAWEEGLPIVVTSGYRSLDQQSKLYEQGRSAPGKIVTHAKPGQSWHNFGLAFDVAPLDATGRPHWPSDWAVWNEIGRIGETMGLSWGGRWKKPDLPHFEYHPDITLADAAKGARPEL